VEGLTAFIRAIGAGRIAAMGAVTIALIGFFAFLMMRITAPVMTPLFTDLSLQDSSTIVRELERQNIPFELRHDGTTVLVPRDQLPRLRMRLAEIGVPRGGGVGYEIFDKSDTLGATSFIQNINRLRALEGELSRAIGTLASVETARVFLVLPERPLFSRDTIEPSASIVLKVRGTLDSQQVRAIRQLVASAVNGLKPARISIVDEAGRLLADGAGDSEVAGTGDERQAAYERRLREQIESIITSVVGPGRARVQLATEFDFNRITQTADRFDPEGRVLRSNQSRDESTASTDAREGQVTVGNELPGAQNAGANPAAVRDQTKKSEEINNYEISRTTRTEVIEGARVKRISVGVLVDGIYGKNDKGEPVYEPRAQEEMDRIAALVRSAIGFDQKRGDVVEVVNLRFAEQPTPAITEPTGLSSWLQFTKDDIMRGVELVVMTLLGLIVVLFVVRPLVRRIIAPETPALGAAGPAPALGAAGAAVPAEEAGAEAAVGPSQAAKMIDIAQVQGQVHAQSIQKVGELANRNPNETVSIIRQWLQEAPT
jgi:flagellar M-ring protein FliF